MVHSYRFVLSAASEEFASNPGGHARTTQGEAVGVYGACIAQDVLRALVGALVMIVIMIVVIQLQVVVYVGDVQGGGEHVGNECEGFALALLVRGS